MSKNKSISEILGDPEGGVQERDRSEDPDSIYSRQQREKIYDQAFRDNQINRGGPSIQEILSGPQLQVRQELGSAAIQGVISAEGQGSVVSSSGAELIRS